MHFFDNEGYRTNCMDCTHVTGSLQYVSFIAVFVERIEPDPMRRLRELATFRPDGP
jgi:hypothetical protein